MNTYCIENGDKKSIIYKEKKGNYYYYTISKNGSGLCLASFMPDGTKRKATISEKLICNYSRFLRFIYDLKNSQFFNYKSKNFLCFGHYIEFFYLQKTKEEINRYLEVGCFPTSTGTMIFKKYSFYYWLFLFDRGFAYDIYMSKKPVNKVYIDDQIERNATKLEAIKHLIKSIYKGIPYIRLSQ